ILEALSMDITETIATLITDHPATPIDCMYAKFRLDNGVIRSDQFFLSTRDSNVRASGYLDLNKQFIDYRIEASAKDFSIGSVGSPVHLTGPLDDIRIRTSRREIFLRTAASIALGTLINPILALVPFVEPGLEKEGQCTRYADRIVRLQYQADDKISSR
ncbi:MAG: AsmA family protein, partial [Pseudobdellovibrionaceae bacterium]|nr:AsmA family protein [Pseudobdellovibrionaceae bacterium]